MAYNPTTIANRFIELAAEAGEQLTPMQLNKLTYIAHGFSLGLRNCPLIDDEVEAWRYGPVIPSLYRKLKHFGAGKVDGLINQHMWRPGRRDHIEPEDDELLKEVYGKYGSLTGAQLSFLTHKKGTPWDRAYQPDIYGITISNDQIGQHYAHLLNA